MKFNLIFGILRIKKLDVCLISLDTIVERIGEMFGR